MHVPRFWAVEIAKASVRGGMPAEVGCWGWSETSVDDARLRASQRAKRLTGRLLDDATPGRYGYDERLPREEIIDEFDDAQGETKAFVSRNNYGSLVLNTRDLVFIDVDFPPRPAESIKLPKFLSKLFGASTDDPPDPVATTENSITEAARQHPDLGFRVYRTRNGFRVIVNNRPIEANSRQAADLLHQFSADPLYVRMCKNQDCFRARLTPKAWRCGLVEPPARFPFANERAESANRVWEGKYHETIAGFSTCHFVQSIGSSAAHESIAEMIDLHDRLTKATSDDPLA
jgi:hypothetical protein